MLAAVLAASVLLAGCSDDDDDDGDDVPSRVEDSVQNFLNDLNSTGKLRKAREYVFTGEITGDELKQLMNSVSNLSYTVTLDFSQCTGSSITLADGTDRIELNGESCLNNVLDANACISRIVLPSGLTRLPAYFARINAHLNSVVLPDSITSIGNDAFRACANLTAINIPSNVTSIEERAFSDCMRLTSITIPDSVTSIAEYAFSGCNNLTAINIPSSVASIANGTFSHCSNLTSIAIPSSVTAIGGFAFEYCRSLTSINIPSSVTTIGGNVFANWTDSKTITVHWGAGDTKPADWNEGWHRGCNAKIINADNNNKELVINYNGAAQS